MTASTGRGHRSGTYDLEDVAVDLTSLSITYRHAAAFDPHQLFLGVTHTRAAEQMLQAMANSSVISENSDSHSGWTSSATLQNAFHTARVMLNRLAEMGVSDFADPVLTVPLLRSLYAPVNSNTKRTACWLLARVIADNHPNGRLISPALRNSRFPVEEGRGQAHNYDDETADAIETAARNLFAARYSAQRELFARLGFDVKGRDWLRVPATTVIEWAHTEHPAASTSNAHQPSSAAPYPERVAWALTHPERFGYQPHYKERLFGMSMDQIGQALYPDNVTVTAGLIVHCLGENSGYNASTLLEKSVDSLVRVGSDHALEHSVKPRASLQDSRPTNLRSIYSPGGVIEVMTGLTRFSRQARAHLRSPDGSTPAVVSRLYVEHTKTPEDAEVLTNNRMHNAWRTKTWESYWPATVRPKSQTPLWLPALRLVAQRRAMAEGLRSDVHGHSERTRVHYASHVLPQHIFDKHATAAQDAFHDIAVAGFTVVQPGDDTAGDLADADPGKVMDVEIGLCTSNGNAPDGPERRCDLGMVACFTCPNGYRTVEHIPGLLAAAELARIIERNDPAEWAQGQASQLAHYAKACLSEYAKPVVDRMAATVDLKPHLAVVTGMYLEMRNA